MVEQSPAAPPQEEPTTNPGRPFVVWLALSAVLVAMLAFAAAHVSGRFGFVCRFAPLFGLAAGAAVGWLAGQGGGTPGRGRSVIGGLLIAAGFVGLTLESYRLYVDDWRRKIEIHPELAVLPAEMNEGFQREREKVFRRATRFGVYLHHRVSENRVFGAQPWKEPWPAMFWGIEIALAGLVGGFAFRLVSRPRPVA